MEVLITHVETIDEDKLIDFLHSVFPTESVDEVMDALAENDEVLMNWLQSQGISGSVEEYSYEELLEYIENNF